MDLSARVGRAEVGGVLASSCLTCVLVLFAMVAKRNLYGDPEAKRCLFQKNVDLSVVTQVLNMKWRVWPFPGDIRKRRNRRPKEEV